MAGMPVTPPAPSADTLDLTDMQGLVARGYGHLPFARYLLCRVGEASSARTWLGQVALEVFTADRTSEDAPCLNVALTWTGLRRLGLSDDALATFPRPLQEGMVEPHRSRILGDSGDSDPSTWRWGGDDASEVDVLVMLFAPTEAALATSLASLRAAFAAGGALTEVVEPIEGVLMDGFEHFGFADGLSQPFIKGWPRRTGSQNPPAPPATKFSDVEPGEILLGYKDNFGKATKGPTVADAKLAENLPMASWSKGRRDLGRNGSFLVFRQLAQDVAGFHQAVAAGSKSWAERGGTMTPERLGAKMVGRWASGAPIVVSPDRDPGQVDNNDFGFAATDANSRSCPVGAHIRRGNPRDSSKRFPAQGVGTIMNHRILRRGRPYGLPIATSPTRAAEEPTAERGLLFICLNADIERQFEFVQHTWINNPYFGGQYGEVDPVIGRQPAGGGVMTIPGDPIRRTVAGLPTFVTTRGGAYFFLPGVKALTYLSQRPA